MRGSRWLALGALWVAAIAGSGCHSSGTKSTTVTAEPGLTDAAEPQTKLSDGTITAPPVRTVGFADRHPLFVKPRQYWESSGDNRIVKAAAATFIGVPAGFVGEVKQIIGGAPPQVSY
jgi:hypothetical protein